MELNTAASLRSRASSVISTGTKFSIATLPQDFGAPGSSTGGVAGIGLMGIDGVLSTDGASSPSPTANGPPPWIHHRPHVGRPMSIYSFRSLGGEQLPAYEESTTDPRNSSNNAAVEDPELGPRSHRSSNSNAASPTPPPPKLSAHPSSASQHPPHPSSSSASASAFGDDLSALKAHYTTLLNHLDAQHTQNLSHQSTQHSLELSRTRNAIDSAYRAELRTATREVERVREDSLAREAKLEETIKSLEAEIVTLRDRHETELEGVRTDLEAKWMAEVERAKWRVEELWEGRWLERERVVRRERERWLAEHEQPTRLLASSAASSSASVSVGEGGQEERDEEGTERDGG